MKVKIEKRTPYLFEPDYAYYPDKHKIRIPKILSPEPFNIFSTLHELGHAHYRHPYSYDPKEKIRIEKEAWNYAFRCVKEEYHDLLEQYKEKLLGTYLGTHKVEDVKDFIKNYKRREK